MISEDEKNLYRALVSIETVDECQRFFSDLCTPAEIEEFTSRWLVARLLKEEKPYRQIATEAGVSTTTVGRVSRFIKYGNNGYNLILERLAKDDQSNRKIGD